MRGYRIVSLIELSLVCLLFGCSDDNAADAQVDEKVGKPCSLHAIDEREPAFSGYSVEESNMVFSSTDFTTADICLVDHFQGRSTCPYGQTDAEITTLPATDPARCRVTADDLSLTREPVKVIVMPQLVARPPEKTIYYTCACSGSDANRKYCSCPTAMHCEDRVPLAKAQISGICVRDDSAYQGNATSPLECSKTSTDPTTDCGNGRQNP